MNDFLMQMEKSLKHMSPEEKQEILADYAEHFEIGAEAGKTQEQIAAELGEPKELAKMYAAMGAVQKAHKTKGFKDTLGMIGAIISYKIGGGLVMAALYFAAVCMMLIFFSAAVGLAAGGVGAASLAAVEFVKGYALYGALAVFTGVVLAAGGLLGLIGSIKLWKLTVGNLSYVAQRIMNKKRVTANESYNTQR